MIQFRYVSILPSLTRFCKCSLQFRFTDKIVCVHTSYFTWTWETHVLNISCFLTKIITQEYQIRSTDYKTSLCLIFNNRNDHPNSDTVVQTQSDVEGLCLPHLRFRMFMCMYVLQEGEQQQAISR
jgi:hypothetical protein